MDYDDEKVELYLNVMKVLEDDSKGRNLPLLKIWIGVIWTGEGGDYGMITEGYFDDVTLGRKDLFPKTCNLHLRDRRFSLCAAAASIIALALIIRRKCTPKN